MALLLEDERDDTAGVGHLVMMVRQEAHDEKCLQATYHEGRVVLDKSIGTTRHYFYLGGVCV